MLLFLEAKRDGFDFSEESDSVRLCLDEEVR